MTNAMLVERLRDDAGDPGLCLQAAAEIERLRIIETRAKLVIKEWRRYGRGVAQPLVDQLAELADDLEQEREGKS